MKNPDEVELELEELEELVKYYINLYFSDKDVTLNKLHHPDYISMVMNSRILESINFNKRDGVSIIYDALIPGEGINKKPEAPHIEKLIELYRSCYIRGIPKVFATGIIIMYLEICEGYEFF